MNSLLNEIQQKLKVPKGQFNAFAKYHYRNAEDILEAVKPLLEGNGYLVLSDEVVQIGTRNYVKATATLYQLDGYKNGTAVIPTSATGWAREPIERKGMDDSQITGATSSYARKYALNGLFCIDDTKDADTETPTPPQNGAKQAPTASVDPKRVQAAKDRIKTLLGLLGEPNDTLAEVSEAVRRLVKLELQSANFDKIGEELAKLVDNK
jgi:hypothetical protein